MNDNVLILNTHSKNILKLKLACYMSIAFLTLTNHDEQVHYYVNDNCVAQSLQLFNNQMYSNSSKVQIETIVVHNELGNTTPSIFKSTEKISNSESNDEKVAYILDRYSLTEEQFKIVAAITLAEAKGEGTCYEDAYAVINTIYNRCMSEKWIYEVDCCMGDGMGTNLYYQVIAPSQFSTYIGKKYEDYLDVTDCDGYQAVLDFLYSEEPMHYNLSFRSSNQEKDGRVQYIDGGNWYFDELTEDEKESINEKSLQYTYDK